MRFCPFCAVENLDEATHCAACAKRLPPPRRKLGTPKPISGLPGHTPTPTVVDPPVAKPVIPAPVPLPPVLPEERAETEPAPTVPVAMEKSAPASGGLAPMPDAPEGGLFEYPRYAIAVWRGRYRRQAAVRELGEGIRRDVGALDVILAALGREVRAQGIVVPGLAEETRLIQEADTRRAAAEELAAELAAKKADEVTRFEATQARFQEKLAAGDQALEEASTALAAEEDKRKSLRERRKEIEREHRDLLRRAADRDGQAHKAPMGEQRQALRVSAEELRGEAKRLEPKRSHLDHELSAIEKPLAEAQARVAAARGDLDETRQALDDAIAGHRERMTELEAGLAHQQRESTQARGEVSRRLVTLGTLANLQRLDRPGLAVHYGEVDTLKIAIARKEEDIERLTGESNQVDRAALVRGIGVLVGVVVLLATAITVVIALV